MTLKRWGAAAFVFIILVLAAAPAFAGKSTTSLNATPTPSEETETQKEVVITPLNQPEETETTADGAALVGDVTSFSVAAGERQFLELLLENKGSESDIFTVSKVDGPEWVSLPIDTLELEARKSDVFAIVAEPPANVASGDFKVRVKAESTTRQNVLATFDVAVKVQPAQETSAATGYATTFFNPTAAAAVIGAGFFAAFIFAYWHRTTVGGQKPKSVVMPVVATTTQEVQKIVSEVHRQEPVPSPRTYYMPPPPAYYSAPAAAYEKLVPYEKVPGKRLWEV